MKKILTVLGAVCLTTLSVQAQEPGTIKDNYPYHTVSKDVQRMQYKEVEFIPAQITTGDASWVNTKAVNNISPNRAPEKKGKVTMTGTPSWVISKEVMRRNK